MYSIYREQTLPINLQEAWDFFSSPSNLSKITPDNLGFKILGNAPEKMYPGLFIHYRVSPLLGIPMKWTTEITQVKDKAYFIDEQRFGPYSFWHHKHFIKEIDGGVLMEDVIHYKIPFGPIGVLLNFLFINSKLNSVFKYRELELIKNFGNFK